jgi:hypothetical protein
MNDFNEQGLNQLFDKLQSERQKIVLEIKNDTDMKNEKILNAKLLCIETLIKNILKYRNLILKERMKDI